MRLEQLDPATGEFSPMKQSGYSPTSLVYLDFVKRLDDAGRRHTSPSAAFLN
jgi:hypothetical protein